jgi:hypothetical protein
MARTIRSKTELEFAVFCIESLASSLHTDAPRVYRALHDESDILQGYIIPEYDVLHTQGKEYIVNDILDVMREKGVMI